MNRSTLLSAAALLLVTLPAPAQQAPDPLWADLAHRDLQAIHDTLLANHPGPVDTVNTAFADWLERGFRRASAMADSVTGPADMLTTLRYYVAGFGDGHTSLNVWWEPSYLQWPGFVAGLVGDRFLVHSTAASWSAELPPSGAEIISCDGTPVASLVRERVMPYRDIDVGVTSYVVRNAPYLFVHAGDRWLPRPESCALRMAEGVAEGERVYDLAWSWIRRSELEERIAAARQSVGRADSTSLTEYDSGQYWVRLPTFAPAGADEARMRDVIARMPSLRDTRLVVFDVRGNGGGTSQWGEDLVEGLFGAELKRWGECRNGVNEGYALWRASAGNLAYLRRLSPQLEARFGPDSDIHGAFSQLVTDMAAALKAGRPLVRQPDPEAKAGACPQSRPPPPDASVVLLTDAVCASACLDFADVLLAMPGVVHVGRQTAADAVYMDVRSVALPGGLGSFILGQKVYRGRVRGHNEPYTPSHRFDGDISDTAALRAWIRRLLEVGHGARTSRIAEDSAGSGLRRQPPPAQK